MFKIATTHPTMSGVSAVLSSFRRIVFIGAGSLGSAILTALQSRLVDSFSQTTSIVVCTRSARNPSSSSNVSFVVGSDALRAAVFHPSTDLVVLCVKPYQVSDVATILTTSSPSPSPSPSSFVLLSCCAGVSIASLESRFATLGANSVVRCMPSTAAALAASATAWFPSASLTADRASAVAHFVSLFGTQLRVAAESHIDIATALAGSGTAYALLFMEAQVDAGVAAGLTRDHARQLVVQTFLGSALLAQHKPDLHLAALRAAVVSPGGTTAAGLRELERGGVRSTIGESIHATLAKAREIRDSNR
jgi:pyrroline-5-carboxylate reductase